jgi:catechol-2,3-dioxygenase
LNVRNSNGAGMRPEKELGLGTITMELWSADDIARLVSRLDTVKWKYEKDNQTLTTRDPRGNVLEFVVR